MKKFKMSIRLLLACGLMYSSPVLANTIRDKSKQQALEIIDKIEEKGTWTAQEIQEQLDVLSEKLQELEQNLALAKYDYLQRTGIDIRNWGGGGALAFYVAFFMLDMMFSGPEGGASIVFAIFTGPFVLAALLVNEGVLYVHRSEARQLRRTINKMQDTILGLQSKLQKLEAKVTDLGTSPRFAEGLDDYRTRIMAL